MAVGYTRQTSFIDGDIILAEHGNLEFNKLVDTLNEVSGHNHDGTLAGGAPVPLLKSPTGTHTLQLTSSGVTGTVVSNDGTLVGNSAFKIPTQQSVKTYVDFNTGGLQTQIDLFSESNHTHANLDLQEAEGFVQNKNASFTADYGYHYFVTAATEVEVTLPTLVTTEKYTITNSLGSAANVEVLNPSYTLVGSSGTVSSGTDLTLEPGDSVVLVATSTTTMEII